MLETISMTLLASALLATAASAQELTGAEAVALLKGKTSYLELPGGPRGKGSAIIFYADDNKAAAKAMVGRLPA